MRAFRLSRRKSIVESKRDPCLLHQALVRWPHSAPLTAGGQQSRLKPRKQCHQINAQAKSMTGDKVSYNHCACARRAGHDMVNLPWFDVR